MHFKDFLACHHDIPAIILLCANNRFVFKLTDLQISLLHYPRYSIVGFLKHDFKVLLS